MFLKRFKEKTHKKHINSKLKSRELPAPITPLKRVGIIVNSDEDFSLDWHKELSALFLPSKPTIDVIFFSAITKKKDNKNETAEPHFYNATHIGWGGTIKNADLKTFIDTNFGLLISYYTTNSTLLKLLTASSNANFKVGILKEDPRINDLIINTELKAFATFKSELIKYIKILKRL